MIKSFVTAMYRLFAQKRARNPVGAPKQFTEKKIDALVALLEKMVDEADGDHEVSLAMVMERGRVRLSSRTVADGLHGRGYWFRDLRHKPLLTPQDVKGRFAFAMKHNGMPTSWWLHKINIHVGNHMFKVATTAKGRKVLQSFRSQPVYN